MSAPDKTAIPSLLTARLSVAVLALALTVPFLVRLRLLAAPFERDEGEYAYAGQLLLDGVPPFAQAFNMKMPGIYAAYAGLMALFGQTVVGIHLGLLLVQGGITTTMFFLGRHFGGNRTGAVAAAVHGILALSITVLGLFPNAEIWVLLPALAGFAALLAAADSARWFAPLPAGILLGTAFVMKQHGIAFVACGALFLLWQALGRPATQTGSEDRHRHGWTLPPASSLGPLAVFLTGALLPFLLVCAWMAYAGVFDRFWFWTFTYAKEYVTQISLLQGWRNLSSELKEILAAAPLLWATAMVGFLFTVLDRARPTAKRFFPVLFLLCGFIATCPGLFFRQHYFLLLLPAIALLSAIGLDRLAGLLGRRATPRAAEAAFLLLFAGGCALPLLRERKAFFRFSPDQVSRLAYGGAPFPESAALAACIREHSAPGDRIAVIGSEPQLYFLSNRRSATGFIYMYPLMEEQPFAREMQNTLIRELETTVPRVIVYVNSTTSWLMRPNSSKQLFEWLDPVLRQHYRPILFADIRGFERTDYVSGAAAESYAPQGKNWVGVFLFRDTH